jgi:hypothetical protein
MSSSGPRDPLPGASEDGLDAVDEITETGSRDSFLRSTRALHTLRRELDDLADELEQLTKGLEAAEGTAKAEVRRTPSRLVVQLGPVAMSMSWLRSTSDTTREGRLLVIEWEGTVSGKAPIGGASGPRPIREEVLLVQATGADDWRWQTEGTSSAPSGTKELAQRCVTSLLNALRRVERRASA